MKRDSTYLERSVWPSNELERVFICPVCRSSSCEKLYEDLIDDVCYVAPGRWSLKKCIHCKSAYLDPRPTKQSIVKAYRNYHTHAYTESKLAFHKLSYFRRVRRKLVNGYVRWKFSSRAEPASALGVFISFLVPGFQRRMDREYRHLPRPHDGECRLLDVGSGNGAFLKLAESCGWSAVGVDPDPVAIETSTRMGLTAYLGGLERFSNAKECFDVITLNHVIEHVHDPADYLRTCLELLKPGGILWLETPNLESNGCLKFRKHWRGLEAPRHLVLFNEYSLRYILRQCDFINVARVIGPSCVQAIFEASFLIRGGVSPYDESRLSFSQRISIFYNRLKEIMDPESSEVLTVIARKK